MGDDNMGFFDFEHGKLMLNVTNKCNFYCAMCVPVRDKGRSTLTKKEAFNVADFAIGKKFHFVEVSGGEPFLVDYTVDLIEKLCYGNITFVQLITNGALITNRDIDRLKGLPNLHVTFSLHGTGDTHDRITTKKGAFEKADHNLRQMADSGVNVALNTVIQKSNYHSIYDIYTYFSDIPYEWHGLTPVEMHLPLEQSEIQIPPESVDEVEKAIIQIRESAEAKGKVVYLPEKMPSYENSNLSLQSKGKKYLHPGFMCSVPRRLLIVYNSGHILPCYHYNWRKYETVLDFRRYDSVESMIMGDDYMNMILKGTGPLGCPGCDTLCYVWDDDFRRKITEPSFMDTTISSTSEYLREEMIKRDPSLLYEIDGIHNINKLKGNRPVYIWGAGRGGILTKRLLKELNIAVSGFIDSDPDKNGIVVSDLTVSSPDLLDKLFNRENSENSPYVVIGSMSAGEIKKLLREKGFKDYKDFQVNERII